MMKKRFAKTAAALSIAAMLMLPFGAAAATKTIAPGATWNIVEDVELDSLTISGGADIKSPGKLLTMIADGVETGPAL